MARTPSLLHTSEVQLAGRITELLLKLLWSLSSGAGGCCECQKTTDFFLEVIFKSFFFITGNVKMYIYLHILMIPLIMALNTFKLWNSEQTITCAVPHECVQFCNFLQLSYIPFHQVALTPPSGHFDLQPRSKQFQMSFRNTPRTTAKQSKPIWRSSLSYQKICYNHPRDLQFNTLYHK